MSYSLNFIRITEYFPKLLHTQKERLPVWILSSDGDTRRNVVLNVKELCRNFYMSYR